MNSSVDFYPFPDQDTLSSDLADSIAILLSDGIAKVQDGDIICMDAHNSILELKVSEEDLRKRKAFQYDLDTSRYGLGRQIFAPLRKDLLGAEEGESAIFTYTDE
jgi:dihydroxyacid dehydratase/phosphogluconate dehydratase